MRLCRLLAGAGRLIAFSISPALGLQCGPALGSELFEFFDIGLEDGLGFGEGFDGAVDAGFTNQVQGRVGRAVGGVADIIDIGVGKLKLRVKAGNLQDARQSQLVDRRVGHFEKVVEVEKVVQYAGVNQQGGVGLRRLGLG